MPKRDKPIVHARDHEHGGADPQRIHYEDVGSGGTGGTLTYIVASQEDQSVGATSTGYLDFFSISTPGASITSGTSITIATAAMYEVLGVGRFTYGDTNIQAQMDLEVNGTTSSSTSVFATFNEGPAVFTMDWSVTVPLLECVNLDVGDILKFKATNNGTFALELTAWRVLIRQLS